MCNMCIGIMYMYMYIIWSKFHLIYYVNLTSSNMAIDTTKQHQAADSLQ